MAGASNDQHNQPHKSDTHQQHRDRHRIVFQPIPITGRHDVQPCFKRPLFLECENRGVRTAIIDADQIPGFPADGAKRRDTGVPLAGTDPAPQSGPF